MATGEDKKKNRLPIFQERFNRLRGEMSQDEFAKKLDISRPTVGFYENGERIPDAIILKKIAEKCNVTSDWLLGLSEVDEPSIEYEAINKMTGLQKESIKVLKNMKLMHEDWDFDELDMLNILIPNVQYRGEESMCRSIIDLITLFFSYNPINGKYYTIDKMGGVKEYKPSGWLSSNLISITPQTLETVFLNEITEALRDLKKQYATDLEEVPAKDDKGGK